MIDDADQQRALNNVMQEIIPEDERPQSGEGMPVVMLGMAWCCIVVVALSLILAYGYTHGMRFP